MVQVKQLKRRIRNDLKSLRGRYLRRRYAYGPEELATAIERTGIGPGDTVLTHISWDSFDTFQGKITDLLAVLRAVVGPDGTLLMPTMPFPGSAIDYAGANPVVDLARTPSRMGLPTELFRRQPDVMRSIHPTHPVAAWGAHAAAMNADHHLCATPCGRQSPFGRLLDHNGQILFLGTGIEVMTFFHTVEEMLETRLPDSPFTEDVFKLTTLAPDGQQFETRTRLFDRDISRRRNISAIIPALRSTGAWRENRIGTLSIIALDAQAVLDTIQAAIRDGVNLYGD